MKRYFKLENVLIFIALIMKNTVRNNFSTILLNHDKVSESLALDDPYTEMIRERRKALRMECNSLHVDNA